MFTQRFSVFLIKFFILFSINNSFEIQYSNYSEFYKLPKFWTYTGFCPNDFKSSDSLLSNDIRIHLNLIGSLPNRGISTIRIHWLLYLIEFNKYEKNNIPVYNFEKLDILLNWIDEAGLSLNFELMGDIFEKKDNISMSYLWEDIVFQIGQRYLGRFGWDKIKKWKFESWNEPDLKSYNIINFTTAEYIDYIRALRQGLNAVSRRTFHNQHLKLYGPAGLFKSKEHHPLCWAALDSCQSNFEKCPFDVFTFHRKGNGHSREIIESEKLLLKDIFNNYPIIKKLPISNDEADPISGWSTPRAFQSDIRYAVSVVETIIMHWEAKLNSKYFQNLESISNDNAFLSYHPHEFNQRTLFARFQMNNSNPIYSQFIAKPVFTSIGMLSNLADFAKNPELIYNGKHNLTMLTSRGNKNSPFYLASVIVSPYVNETVTLSLTLRIPTSKNENFAYCLESLISNWTNPVEIWDLYGKQPYPNVTSREWMRRVQGPKIVSQKTLKPDKNLIKIRYQLKSPWVALLRVCSSKISSLMAPYNLRILEITDGEVLILWNEIELPERCIKTYEIQFSSKKCKNHLSKKKCWKKITRGWRVPFLSFHFKPKNGIVKGFYRVRAENLFKRQGNFSETIYYE